MDFFDKSDIQGFLRRIEELLSCGIFDSEQLIACTNESGVH